MKEVKSSKKPLIYYYCIVLLIIFLFNMFITPLLTRGQVTEVDYGTFMRMTDERQIGSVQVEDTQILFTAKEGDAIYKTTPMEDPDLTQRLHDSGAEFTRVIEEPISPIWSILLTVGLPLAIFALLGHYMNKKMMEQLGGKDSMAFGMGKSNAKVYVQSTKGIKFSDVAGEDEAKESLSEIVDYLHNPGKYSEAGASMPKGLLLVGPPGTGKTMLAKAVAGEANVPFFSISGSEFVEMFVGMGASKVRDLFRQAKEKAPCIVFIDEIDAIGQKRSAGNMGGNDEREQTLNQLLAEMDGFDPTKGVILLAATNRPEVLDQALLRPGRFDRRIPVELPDLEGKGVFGKAHPKGTGRRSLQLLRLLFPKPAMTGFFQKTRELLGGNRQQILRRRVLREHFFRSNTKGIRKQCVVLRKHLIQQRDDPALAVPAGIHQRQPVPAQLPHRHDDLL